MTTIQTQQTAPRDSERVLSNLRETHCNVLEAEKARVLAVASARMQLVSWKRIAELTGLAGASSARSKFGPAVDEILLCSGEKFLTDAGLVSA